MLRLRSLRRTVPGHGSQELCELVRTKRREQVGQIRSIWSAGRCRHVVGGNGRRSSIPLPERSRQRRLDGDAALLFRLVDKGDSDGKVEVRVRVKSNVVRTPSPIKDLKRDFATGQSRRVQPDNDQYSFYNLSLLD